MMSTGHNMGPLVPEPIALLYENREPLPEPDWELYSGGGEYHQPRSTLTNKQRAKRKARNKMAKASRRKNRR